MARPAPRQTRGAAIAFRIRDLPIRRRKQAINALRGHPGAFVQILPRGASDAARPADAIAASKVPVGGLTHLETGIGKLDAETARRAKGNEVARRRMTAPRIGPLIAAAVAVLAPPPETFRKARNPFVGKTDPPTVCRSASSWHGPIARTEEG